MVLLDAVARMIPGVVGDADSPQADSFYEPLLDHVDLRVDEVGRAGVRRVVLDSQAPAVATEGGDDDNRSTPARGDDRPPLETGHVEDGPGL